MIVEFFKEGFLHDWVLSLTVTSILLSTWKLERSFVICKNDISVKTEDVLFNSKWSRSNFLPLLVVFRDLVQFREIKVGKFSSRYIRERKGTTSVFYWGRRRTPLSLSFSFLPGSGTHPRGIHLEIGRTYSVTNSCSHNRGLTDSSLGRRGSPQGLSTKEDVRVPLWTDPLSHWYYYLPHKV